MKLIIAIVNDSDSDKVTHALTSDDYRVTFIASTGGFLRRGHSTFLIGLEDDRVEKAISIVKENTNIPDDPEKKRATFFVLNVNQFIQI
ncbi:MAG: cyclic-di-AMP receptor [Anaerolineaceae bacterium]|nr:cyclic-di-AMP receptor [Anaerolineaceae bacterium]